MYTVESNGFRQAAIPALNSAPIETDGQLGIAFIPLILIGATTLLGGGTLWVLHEKHTEKELYFECIEENTAPKGAMSPQEAKIYCSPGLKPKGFSFGLNVPTLLLVGGIGFGLWFTTQLMMAAVRK